MRYSQLFSIDLSPIQGLQVLQHLGMFFSSGNAALSTERTTDGTAWVDITAASYSRQYFLIQASATETPCYSSNGPVVQERFHHG